MATDHKPKLHLALIGLGNQGQEHLQGMRASEHTTFVAGVDVSETACRHTQQEHPSVQVFSSIEALGQQAQSLQLDGLVLCLPHHRYAQDWKTIAALQLPVLKEKPLGRSVEEARQLSLDLPGNRLKTAIQRRHHPSYRHLKELLGQDKASVKEIHTWLHLGRPHDPVVQEHNWRHQAQHAGGGILLDAGYHIVDLVHFLIGPIELVHCTTWSQHQQSAPDTIEDEAQLLGRSAQCWVMMDARLGGELSSSGHIQKSEGIRLATDKGQYFANRTEVSRDGEVLWRGEKDWQQAMGKQLDEFADDIRNDRWNTSSYWDQLPAMQLIESAYQLSRRF